MYRYLFNHHNWKPSRPEWLRALSSLELDEQNKILNLVYQRDAKAAVIGRLLIRNVIKNKLGLSGDQISIERTEKGRPFLAKPMENFDFNLSHNGHLTVLTAVFDLKTGVDVMQVMRPNAEKSIDEYFNKMRPVFTESEWDVIRDSTDESESIRKFYRHWCLKEAYTKAIGEGLAYDFSKLECRLATQDRGPWCGSSKQDPHKWQFEEHYLQEDHVCAVAWYGDKPPDYDCLSSFMEVKFDDLIVESKILRKAELEAWDIFKKKDHEPPSKRTPLI